MGVGLGRKVSGVGGGKVAGCKDTVFNYFSIYSEEKGPHLFKFYLREISSNIINLSSDR